MVNNENVPLKDHVVHCKDASATAENSSLERMTSEDGKVEFAFESVKKSIEIDINANGNFFNYEFQDGDFVTFKLFSDDNLNMFLELMVDNDEMGA
jgi:hypothetical protein